MQMKKWILALMGSALLFGCGGGDESPPPAPAAEASVEISVSTPTLSLDLAAGDEIGFTVDGSCAATGTGLDAAYLQMDDGADHLAESPVTIPLVNGSFSFPLTTLPSLSDGTWTGTITLRACRDSDCLDPYATGEATVDYTLNVAAVADWETHQRNAAHDGYVPILLDPSRFAEAWQWSRDAGTEPIGGINAVVTNDQKVYVTQDVYFGGGILYALAEADGSEAWRVSLGSVPALNPPAVSGGQVYAAVTGHEETFLWAFDAGTGDFLHKSPFGGQWPHFLAPTVYGDQVYTGGGYYGGMTYAFSTADGSPAWTHSAGGVWDMYTPAVDENTVYHHNGTALFLINRATGTTTSTITDPFGGNASYDYHGAPVLGGRNNVIAFSGGALSGSASSNTEQWQQRVLSSFELGSRTWEWATSHAYLTAPAVADGIIYAGRNDPMSLDAIDEETGEVLWNWSTTANGDTSFHRNMVVTRNLLFVSTDKAVYALDLVTRTPVWSYPEPGMLAISADRTLYIATGIRESDGRLVAVSLK
jgi:outer membrane protein assembly factor BamB